MRKILLFGALVLAAASCGGGKTELPDKPRDIEITLSGPPSARDKRVPITFDYSAASEFTVDLKMRNYDGSTRTSFTGPNAWVRLSFAPAGKIVESAGPKGKDDPDVAGPNVHFTNGEAKGIKVRVIGAYGDTRLVAEDVGFVPADPGKLSACSNGRDDDDNGYADWPNDPNCLYLNDDSEAPFDAAFGTSQPIYFAKPTIYDVQYGTATPFLAKQVDLQADVPSHLVVTAVTNQGMYVTDVNDTRGSNSIFVFTFSAPYGVQACDTLTRLSGNVSDFFGGTQLGTPGYTAKWWIDPAKSGACPIPDFKPIDGSMSGFVDQMEALESSLVSVKDPIIGTHFGKGKVCDTPTCTTEGKPVPSDGKSNCDLNGDGIVGFNSNKGGFNELEKACNDACTADPDCTEWNNYLSFANVKIKFAPGDGTLFFSPSAIPGFDVAKFVGPGKLAEVRGVLTNFVGPTPPYTVEPRCADDVIPVGKPASEIKDARTACVRNRIGVDAEGQN